MACISRTVLISDISIAYLACNIWHSISTSKSKLYPPPGHSVFFIFFYFTVKYHQSTPLWGLITAKGVDIWYSWLTTNWEIVRGSLTVLYSTCRHMYQKVQFTHSSGSFHCFSCWTCLSFAFAHLLLHAILNNFLPVFIISNTGWIPYKGVPYLSAIFWSYQRVWTHS